MVMNKSELLSLKVHKGTGLKNLIDISELEKLVNLRPFCKYGRWLPTTDDEKFTWNNSYWSTEENSAPISIIEHTLTKGSNYFVDCSKVNERINNTCAFLEDVFKSPVDCHIFFSRNKQGSFNLHKDDRHNVIVGCVGKLELTIEDKRYILDNGDYVFIPCNTYHKVVPLSDKRISCSFPISSEQGNFEERKWFKL
jgi:hypothetical protein